VAEALTQRVREDYAIQRTILALRGCTRRLLNHLDRLRYNSVLDKIHRWKLRAPLLCQDYFFAVLVLALVLAMFLALAVLAANILFGLRLLSWHPTEWSQIEKFSVPNYMLWKRREDGSNHVKQYEVDWMRMNDCHTPTMPSLQRVVTVTELTTISISADSFSRNREIPKTDIQRNPATHCEHISYDPETTISVPLTTSLFIITACDTPTSSPCYEEDI
jgi:hypothetical protein